MHTAPPTPSPRVATLFGLLLLITALPTGAQSAWTMEVGADVTHLARLELQTAEVEPVAAIDVRVVGAMTRGPSGDLFLLGAATLGEPSSTLYRLDPVSFELEEIGPLDLPNTPFVRDMTALPDGRLLMSAQVGVPVGLYLIDPETAEASLVAETEGPILTLATLGNRVFATFRTLDDEYGLYAVDPETAVLTFLHPLPGDLFGLTNAMAEGLDGRLYLSNEVLPPTLPPILYRVTSSIDPSTGAAELLTNSAFLITPSLRGLTLIDDNLAVAVPVGSPVGRVVLLTLLLVSGLAAIRHRL
ncbi:MAG: hypothetical protein AAGM22_17170 [Acidobacteriota bacterium]